MSPLTRLYVRGARRLLRPPRLLLDRLPPVERDGLRLDPQVQWMLGVQRLAGRGPMERHRPERARRDMRFEQSLADIAPPPPLHEVRDLHIEGAAGPLPARLYRPAPPAGRGPGLVYFHGGGFVVGGLDSHETACRLLARDSGVAVLSVDYRLAPEHPFPAAVEDALASWRWAVEAGAELGLDPARLAVGGDSAGGCLAAVVAQRGGRVAGRGPSYQLLIYPAVDRAGRRPSRELFAEGFLLSSGMLSYFMGHYLQGGEDLRDARISPYHFEDLRGLPPAHVLSAGFDPLRDEAEDYAARLRAAGVSVTLSRASGLPHGFLQTLGVVDAGRAALREAAGRLAEGLRDGGERVSAPRERAEEQAS